MFSLPAPSPPSSVSVSQNGLGSVLVSWTPPSGEPAVTGYIIYYQQDGGQRLYQGVESTTKNTTITGLNEGTNYSIIIVATFSTLSSNETEAEYVTIGKLTCMCFSALEDLVYTTVRLVTVCFVVMKLFYMQVHASYNIRPYIQK